MHHDSEDGHHCGDIRHEALAVTVWLCVPHQAFEARVTMHDCDGAVHSQEEARFGPFDSWLDVERWVTTVVAARLHSLGRVRVATAGQLGPT